MLINLFQSNQFLLSSTLFMMLLTQVGYLSRDKLLPMACTKYCWPKMVIDVTTHLFEALSCVCKKKTTNTAPYLICPFRKAKFFLVI